MYGAIAVISSAAQATQATMRAIFFLRSSRADGVFFEAMGLNLQYLLLHTL